MERPRAIPLLLILLVGFLPWGCGGSPDDEPTDGPVADLRDTLAEETARSEEAPEDPVVPVDSAAGTTGEEGVAPPGEAATSPREGEADRPTGGPAAAGSGGEGSALPDWTTGEFAWQPADRPQPPVIAELRYGRNEGFDRWVVRMWGTAVPGYRVRYVDEPLHECGSGREILPEGDGWLELRLEPAHGHTEEGDPTIPREVETPSLTEGVRVYRTCDFEGTVTLVMAVRNPGPFRAFHLREPARVVVDVRH